MLAHEPSFNIMDSEILGFLDFLPFSLPAAKKEITFFPTLFCTLKCSPMAVVWFLHASSHRYHVTIQIVKVTFKILSYLTLFPLLSRCSCFCFVFWLPVYSCLNALQLV